MNATEPKLVFVYNADSGFFEALMDGVTKIVSPASYSCRLCALTYGLATMRPRWRRFVDALGIPVEFLHKDEFQEKYPDTEGQFPSAYIDRGSELEIFITSNEMNSRKTLDELMEAVESKLEELDLKRISRNCTGKVHYTDDE
jgi:hypothetical protein